LGVAIPNALLAVIPLMGELSGAFDARWRAGVPATDGVPAKKSGRGGGALGTDCSIVPFSVSFPISTSSDDGKSSAGGDDMTVRYGKEEVWEEDGGRVASRQYRL